MRVKTGLGIVFAILMGSSLSAAVANPHKMKMKSDRELVKSAMSAAPAAIAKGATVMAMDEKGNMRTVRKGTNDWTCMPDNPGTPTNDPMCVDPNGLDWMMAFMSHKPPPDKVGFGYMLMGASDASNTDPYAATPAKGDKWLMTGPHIMIFGPPVKGMAGYGTGANPDTRMPYIMWGGTPYEHLMIPVK